MFSENNLKQTYSGNTKVNNVWLSALRVSLPKDKTGNTSQFPPNGAPTNIRSEHNLVPLLPGKTHFLN